MLFRTLTGEDWQLILWDTVNPSIGGGWWGYIYWLSFNFIVVIVMLKLFVLVIVDQFLRQDNHLRNRTEEQLYKFQVAWATQDPRGTGFLRVDDLRQLLLRLPAPFGLPAGCSFRDYLAFCDSLKLMTWSGYVNYSDVLLALHRVTYGVGMPPLVLAGVASAPAKIHARVTLTLKREMLRSQASMLMRRAMAASALRFMVPCVPDVVHQHGPLSVRDVRVNMVAVGPLTARVHQSHRDTAARQPTGSLLPSRPSVRPRAFPVSKPPPETLLHPAWLSSSSGVTEVSFVVSLKEIYDGVYRTSFLAETPEPRKTRRRD